MRMVSPTAVGEESESNDASTDADVGGSGSEDGGGRGEHEVPVKKGEDEKKVDDDEIDDGLIIGENGKTYRKRKPLPDVWSLLQNGAPESEEEKSGNGGLPRSWYDELAFPISLLLTFCLSLMVWHMAPHDKSVGRKMNRFTVDNIADGEYCVVCVVRVFEKVLG